MELSKVMEGMVMGIAMEPYLASYWELLRKKEEIAYKVLLIGEPELPSTPLDLGLKEMKLDSLQAYSPPKIKIKTYNRKKLKKRRAAQRKARKLNRNSQ